MVAASSTIEFPVGPALLGRILDATGMPLDGGPPPSGPRRAYSAEPPKAPAGPPELLETGIKAVDLLAPIIRGGCVQFIGGAGVGKLVLLSELLRTLGLRRNGCAIFLGLEERTYSSDGLLREYREAGVAQLIGMIFARRGATPEDREQVPAAGLAAAGHFRDEGREVLLLADARLLSPTGLAELRAGAGVVGTGAITLGLLIDPEDDQPIEAAGDTQIVLSRERARRMIYPAVDPVQSRSPLLEQDNAGEQHNAVAAEVRGLLMQHEALLGADETTLAALSDEERRIVGRARRLDRFLSQPFFTAESYTGLPGAFVSLQATIAAFQRLLAGEANQLPLEALQFTGDLEI